MASFARVAHAVGALCSDIRCASVNRGMEYGQCVEWQCHWIECSASGSSAVRLDRVGDAP